MILFATAVSDFINKLHNAGVEIWWLTTWADLANQHISPFLGLPQFPVAGDPDKAARFGWWKLNIARKMWEDDKVPFIWIDDDLDYDNDARGFLERLDDQDCLPLTPSTYEGITPEHIKIITVWLEDHGIVLDAPSV